MINEEVIQKLGLIDEGTHQGQSFIHNCQILTWPIRERFKVYVMDCDLEGIPLKDGMLRIFWSFRGKSGVINITYEAIMIDDILNHFVKEIPE